MKVAIESTTPGLKMAIESTTPGLKMAVDDAVFAAQQQLIFATDTNIVIPGVTINASLVHRLTYTLRRDSTGVNADIWGTDDGACYGRLRSADFRAFRGGSGGNIGAIAWAQGQQYDVEEDVSPAGTNAVTFTPGPLSGSIGVGSTGSSTGMQIGGRVGGLGFVGLIREFKIFDETDTLIHHWPIDDDVIDGGEITDIVGGANGTLTLGAGMWEDRS